MSTCSLKSVAASSLSAEPCTPFSQYRYGRSSCHWHETVWCDVFTVLDYHAVYVCSCLLIFWDTSIHCITTQKSKDLIYTVVEAWNLITLCYSSQCIPPQCWQKCSWKFTFFTFVFLFLHLHLLVLRHIRFNNFVHCSEVCVCHMLNRMVITEYTFLKWYTPFQLIGDILDYAKFCSIFTIIDLV